MDYKILARSILEMLGWAVAVVTIAVGMVAFVMLASEDTFAVVFVAIVFLIFIIPAIKTRYNTLVKKRYHGRIPPAGG